MELIENMFADAGIKPTAIRIIVMREIIAYNHPFTLADMENRLTTIDKSTLFRTLTLFLEHKILHDVDNGSGSRIYCKCECAPMYTTHTHFTCSACGQTFCIKNIDTSIVQQPEGFIVEESSLVMKGLCPKCAKRFV